MTGREARARVTALWTGRAGGRRALAAPPTALLLALCVLLCLCVAAAIAGAASATPAPAPPAAQGLQLLPSTVDLGRPTVKAPSGTTTSLKPTFTWSRVKGARSYDLRICQGGVLRRFFRGQHGTSRHIKRALPAGVTLTFKVRARNARGAGAWSRGAKFVISAPTPESPVGAVATTSPTFRWAALRGAARYDISVSGGGVRLAQSDVAALSHTFDRDLPTNAPLTWKVRGSNADGTGAWSKSTAFTIAKAQSADLTGLALSGSPTGYTFAAGTYTYSGVTVAYAVSSVTVTPTGSGTITVEGTAVASGTASDPIALAVGTAKTITVVATETGKSAKTYTIEVTRRALAVGDAYQGGIVAYILRPGDPGYVAGQTKGLIAATDDQGTSVVWALPDYQWKLVPGGTGTAIGTGSANTDKIISQNGAGTNYAAGLARAYRGGDYSDWYLPSQDELDTLYANRLPIGGFDATGSYWSSTEDGALNAWYQYFGGSHYTWLKYIPMRVRAVRSFSMDPAKAITAFSFASPAATGVITESAHTIAVSVPFGTPVTALVASFTTTGASVKVSGTAQTSGTTANDFTSPVTYRVTAGDGSTQDYVVTVAVAAPEIGQSYAGGKVAYILKEGDPGHVAGETHGLIAATVDQSTGAAWAVAAYQRFAVPGGTDTALGTGSVNTTSIVAQNGAGSTYAAGLADVYTNADTGTGIYSDWYLPSKDELNKLFINRVAIGGFAADFYWSSSELAGYPGEAWGQYFVNGNQDAGVKSLTQHRVRAVRSF